MGENKQLAYANTIAQTLGLSLPKPANYNNLCEFIEKNKASYYRLKNEKTRDAIIHGVKIIDIAKEMGFHVVKRGKYYSLKEHDSVMIEPYKNIFWQNSISNGSHTYGGSVIDFVSHFSGIDIKTAFLELKDRVEVNEPGFQYIPPESMLQDIKELILPEAASHMKNVFAYLIKSRNISPSVVQYMAKEKMLYMDKNNNCVFVARENDIPVYALKRGTNTNSRFVGDVAGCDYNKGFYIGNGSDSLIVTESVIDAMSIMTILLKKKINYKKYNYLSLNGATKYDCIINQLKNNPDIKKINLCLDNDSAGISNSKHIIELIKETYPNQDYVIEEHRPSYTKDWNDELNFYIKLSKKNVKKDKLLINNEDFFVTQRTLNDVQMEMD